MGVSTQTTTSPHFLLDSGLRRGAPALSPGAGSAPGADRSVGSASNTPATLPTLTRWSPRPGRLQGDGEGNGTGTSHSPAVSQRSVRNASTNCRQIHGRLPGRHSSGRAGRTPAPGEQAPATTKRPESPGIGQSVRCRRGTAALREELSLTVCLHPPLFNNQLRR